MKKIELLAPAKDLECGIAAIDCGADGVYIGASKFGARENAGNEIDDITALVKHAHKYWAKVYVTLNTLLHDEEIQPALEMINQLYDIGVDALIIQDVGLLECDLPPIPLIASTQMHNTTPERVAFLENVGFKRAILARELSLPEIKEIRKNTKTELEFFVHGSICVGYSGQCYLSFGLGGRSGNRGRCAQPCRRLYRLVDANGRILGPDSHYLSLCDLNLSQHLGELIDAGICSFKIEGRLKDKAYVANVTAYYNTLLNKVMAEKGLSRSSSGTSRPDFDPDPAKTFNRGFTSYFLMGGRSKVGSIETPKMVGEPVGKAEEVRGRAVTIDSDVPMHRGDGISYFDRFGVLRGTVINDVKGRTLIADKPKGIEPGTLIYRNHDHEFITRLEKSSPEREISVEITLRETVGGFLVKAADEDGNSAEFSFEAEKIPADKPEQALENMKKQLSKTGGSGFACFEVKIETERAYFLPISALNTMRRGILDELTAAREKNRPVEKGGFLKNSAPFPEKSLTFKGNVLNSKAAAFYKRHGVGEIEKAAESGLDMRDKHVMSTRYCIKYQLGICPKEGSGSRPPEPLYLIDEDGHRLELRFDCARCGMDVYLLSR